MRWLVLASLSLALGSIGSIGCGGDKSPNETLTEICEQGEAHLQAEAKKCETTHAPAGCSSFKEGWDRCTNFDALEKYYREFYRRCTCNTSVAPVALECDAVQTVTCAEP